MTSNILHQSSTSIYRKEQVQATYCDPIIPSYCGNPFIEALPSILSKSEAMRCLAYFPTYKEEYRHWNAHLRLHLLLEGMDFFMPYQNQLDLEQRFALVIRYGYKDRNPFKPGFWSDINQRVNEIDLNQVVPIRSRSAAKSFTILGPSGVGKTTAIERILERLYPQVINHSHYGERDFTCQQIVWLKLDCPHDGSIKGLCLNFLQAVDDLLETSYYKNYAKNGNTPTHQLIGYMARVARNYCPGVLVIDEIQNLSEVNSGGHKQMLNFFVQLINTMDLPIILVGTYKAFPLLSGEFRMMRRGTGQGDMVWNPMQENETWQTFINSLWRYQYVQKTCPLTPKLSHALYYECQGITDLAVKIYMLAQVRAIESGKEEIAKSIIQSAAKDYLCTAREFMNALKQANNDGNWKRLIKYEDIHPIDITPFIEEAQSRMVAEDRIDLMPGSKYQTFGSEIDEMTNTEPPLQLSDFPEEEPATDPKNAPTPTVSKTNQRPIKSHKQANLKTLPEIVTQTAAQGISAYEALRQAGYIRPATEYLLED